MPLPSGGVGRVALLAVWIALGSGCQLLLDFSELPDGGAAPDDDGNGGGGSDASSLCSAGEPNESVEEAEPASLDAEMQGSVCGGGDRDFYGFTLDGNQDVVAELTFTAGEADDLEMNLVASDGTVLTLSTGLDSDERIEHSMALGNRLAAGDYAADVFGRTETVSNDYTLTITVTTPTVSAGR